MHKISIIVPVYNVEKYLERCVNSILSQTYENIEIVLVNDGSPDNSPTMCDQYAKVDERVKVIHKENGGLVSAWQAGVRASDGKYLCFVDSDDWVEPDMVSEMYAYLSAGNADSMEIPSDKKEIICCNFVIDRFTGDDMSSGQYKVTKHYHELKPGIYEGKQLETDIKDQLLGHENRLVSMSRCMKLFSRRLIEDNMKYCNPDITFGEDVNIVLPALLDCERLVIMEEALFYHYFYNYDSMVHKYDKKLYEGICTLRSVIKEIFEDKKRQNGEMQGDKEYIYLLMFALKNEIRGGRKNYSVKVREICNGNQDIVMTYPVIVGNKINRILYFLLKNPKLIYINVVRFLFRLGDGLHK